MASAIRASSSPTTCLPPTTSTGTTISPVRSRSSLRQWGSFAMLRSSKATEFCERNSLTLQHSCQVGSVVPLLSVYRTTSRSGAIPANDSTGLLHERTLVLFVHPRRKFRHAQRAGQPAAGHPHLYWSRSLDDEIACLVAGCREQVFRFHRVGAQDRARQPPARRSK